ncbi:MAG: hypothetical protein AAFU67_06845 [Bacteroidota bacterium]
MRFLPTIFLIVALYSPTHLFSQDYSTAIGLRLGPYYGLTVKHFIASDRALEGILATRSGGFGITGLYEVHRPAFQTDRLNVFTGFGGHLNVFEHGDRRYWEWDDDGNRRSFNDGDTRLALGVDFIIGLEYTLTELPINFGVDWKPALNLIGDFGLSLNQLAASVRFVL